MLTARPPEAALADFCGRHHLLLVRVSGPSRAGDQAQSGAGTHTRWAGVRLAPRERSAALQALIDNPALSIIVRPDRVVAAVEPGSRVPRLPWPVPTPQPVGAPAA